MGIGESMALIAKEAEGQGFLVRQTRSTMWHFRKGQDNWFFSVKDVGDVIEVLSVLINAGLDWSTLGD